MNSWLILLLLLLGNQNGCGNNGNSGCGSDSEGPQTFYRSGGRNWDGDRDGNFEREYGLGRNRDNGSDCDCAGDGDDNRDSRGYNNSESRFEPRFDARPFNNNPECGCDNQ